MLVPLPIGELLATLFTPPSDLPPTFTALLDRLEATADRIPFPNTLSDADFRREIEHVLPPLRAFAISLTRDRGEADDLVQDAMMKAWAARDRFQAGTNFRAWCFVILRNLFMSERRRAKFKCEWDEISASRLLAAPASQEHPIHLNDLQRAMAGLVASQREALLLVGAAGMSYEEAAQVMRVAVGTVKSRVARGRQALEASLDGTSAVPPSNVPTDVRSRCVQASDRR